MMLPNKIATEELKSHINTAHMRAQLHAQIVKDLGIEAWEISSETEDFFTHLRHELYYTLQAIIERQPHLLPNMIYRIDIDERTVQDVLTNPDANASEALAELILNREMKKVFYRNVYNGTIKL